MEEAYHALQRTVEREFQRGVRLHGARIKCTKGCSSCCSNLFQITEFEANYISRAIRQLPPERRDDLIQRAQAYMDQRRQLRDVSGQTESWGHPPQGAVPCPALEDGACGIYEVRPLMCRFFGVPLHNPSKPNGVMVCELNFPDGEGFRDPDLIQIQTGIAKRWDRLQTEYTKAGGHRDPEAMCVGRAIAEDFSANCLK